MDSQFLPSTNIQYAWDSTALGDLKKCAYYYYMIHIEGYTTRDENIHLRFGTEVHQSLHDYELLRQGGVEHDDAVDGTVDRLLRRIFAWEPDIATKAYQTKNKDTLVRSVIWYLDRFKNDPAETYTLSDGKPAIEVSFKWDLDYGPRGSSTPYMLCGHLDRIVRYPRGSNDLFVMDRKSTSMALTDYYFQQFEPNNQMTIYTMSSQIVIHSPVKGVIIDAMQIKADQTLFNRRFTYRTEEQLQEWLVDLKFWLAQADSYARANYWPRNDTACTMYGGCKLREICNKSPSQRERFLEGNFIKLPKEDRWNPLRTR
jgi:hypothetical protein